MRRMWSSALRVTLLIVSLVGLSGCGSLAGASSATPTAAEATPTPIATPIAPTARPLTWAPARLPTAYQPTIGVAQSDGATAYVCAPASSAATSEVVAWVTHDRGVHWQPTEIITTDAGSGIVNGQTQALSCQIIVDTTQANTAVAEVGFMPAAACFPAIECINYALYLTTDAGRHWARLPPPKARQAEPPNIALSAPIYLDTLVTLATRQGVTFALFRSTPRSATTTTVALVMSRDHMRNWAPVPGLMGLTITGFWLNPFTGALLVTTSLGGYNQVTCESSTNDGASWSILPAPPFPFAFYDFVVQQPFTDQPWAICGGDPSSMFLHGVQQNPYMDTLACTSDSGAHWETHQLNVPNDRGGEPDTGANYTLVGVADDGAALLTTPAGLERVISGSAGAQALGSAPNAGQLLYTAGGGAGALWSGPQPGYPDPQGRIFTASYT